MERWNGKVAVVTGASSGIGYAIATELVKNGIHVVAFARRIDRLTDMAKNLSGEKATLHPRQADMTKEEEIVAAFNWIKSNLGGVDILVNNAGIVQNSTLADGKTEDWRKLFDTNVLGLCVATREAVRSMRARDVDGHIIHINSVAGHKVPAYIGHEANVYPASKHAVTALAETLRLELLHEKTRIKVTSISPALVSTEIAQTNKMRAISDMMTQIRVLDPVDVANAALYVLGTPPHVLVTELTLRSVEQQ